VTVRMHDGAPAEGEIRTRPTYRHPSAQREGRVSSSASRHPGGGGIPPERFVYRVDM
jgi:hypothetical protein